MATSLEQIADFLRADGRWFLTDIEGDCLHTRAEGVKGRWEVEIRLSEEGECLHLRIPRIVALGDSPHAAELCFRLLELHYHHKLGRFGLDPVDGEIDCEIVLPLDDATLTRRQLRRALTALVLLVDQQAERFRHLLAHGEEPADAEAEQLEGLLTQLAESLGLTPEQLADRLEAGLLDLPGESDA